jgi:glycosyltransferase involved in cell wall biosynthesis
MKVTVAGYQAISILHGGPNTQLRNTVAHLKEHGVEARFFDPWAPFRKEECDLFHLFAANIGTYHLAREIHGLGVPLAVSPIIYSLHSTAYIRKILGATRLLQKAGKGIWSDYALCADICSWAGRVLPNSHAEGTMVAKGLGVPAGRISVVPNGVDERFADADPSLFRKEFGVDKFILTVGHTGHMRKNVLSLIKALGRIDVPAVIIGRIVSGPYGDACVYEASKHRHIRLVEGITHDSPLLASAYAACDVFVLPSMFETPGIAALEAGLAGAKVVITPHGGPKEYFGALATYVNPRSVDAIRAGIVQALERPRTTDLRDHIRRNFLWPRVAELTAAAYRQILEERGQHPSLSAL